MLSLSNIMQPYCKFLVLRIVCDGQKHLWSDIKMNFLMLVENKSRIMLLV